MKILVTGAAGFIGSALVRQLVAEGHEVIGLDNYNDYYDVSLKRARVQALIPAVSIIEGDFGNNELLRQLFSEHQFDVVCHLAAMAGVRYSMERPEVYTTHNIVNLVTLLETMKQHGCARMVFASSSSVYGNDTEAPFVESAVAGAPESVYGATKRAGELLLHSYFAQYGMQATALRFFTVYGPWSRPDMAMLKFAQKMVAGDPIEVYNHGDLRRDFTYIDDIVTGFVAAVNTPLGFEICNLGGGRPIPLLTYIELLEASLGITAQKIFLPMQAGDVYETYADTHKADTLLGFKAKVPVEQGIEQFARWFKDYYQV